MAVQVDDFTAQSAAAAVTDALSRGRRLHLSYYVPGRDEATERDVDPMRLLVVEGRSYLEGWCRRAGDVRLFRLDRILAVEVLDVASEVPAGAEHVDVDHGLFRPSPQDVVVEFELAPAGRWVAEYYPCDQAARPSRRAAPDPAAHARHADGAAARAPARRGWPAGLAARARGAGCC